MSAEARRLISEAQKARWAQQSPLRRRQPADGVVPKDEPRRPVIERSPATLIYRCTTDNRPV
jgi:hypothetical protein